MTKPPPDNAEWVIDTELFDCRILTLGDKTYYGVAEGWREVYGTLIPADRGDDSRSLLGPPLPRGGPLWPNPTP